MKFIQLLLFFITITLSAQQGGIWIPSLLEGMNEEEMRSLGSKLTASDIYDINQSSLKDAIGHFNGGCTSEVISSKGLLLTNHHCGYGQIQSHSSVENDLTANGFWAKNYSEELPNEGLYIEFIVRIEDVTSQVLNEVNESLTEKEKQSLIDKNIDTITKSATKEEWQGSKVKPFYHGNQYFLFITERYEDIRLVGAPPASIGKFGSDTDNWVWPRHTGDFALFRIYADKNNKPAKYSEDNVPFTPKHHLPVSLDGVSEDDFTLVFGFPGRTNEYLPAVAIEQITQKINPSNIEIRKAALNVIDEAMQQDDEVRIQYASKQARIANYWKKWIGENQGIEKSNAIAKKKEFEAEFTKLIQKNGLEDNYGSLLTDFDAVYAKYENTAIKRSNFLEIFIRNNDLLQACFRFYQLENAYQNNPATFDQAKNSLGSRIKSIYKNYNASVDQKVFQAIIPYYTDKGDVALYKNSKLTNADEVNKILELPSEELINKINEDAFYSFAKSYIKDFYDSLNPEYQDFLTQRNAIQKKYMKAMMEVMPEERYFPDANGTLRVTYGKVNGYQPRDGVYYTPVTYLVGVMEKYIPNDYEFDVPEKLQELYQQKDYGNYADKNGKLPVCFIGTNHTTGGNSGSPTIDAHGNLIGLNFDRVWEGTMSDMNYDPEICRNIMVDARYILFIIDKYAGAGHLVDEMTLVHPKSK